MSARSCVSIRCRTPSSSGDSTQLGSILEQLRRHLTRVWILLMRSQSRVRATRSPPDPGPVVGSTAAVIISQLGNPELAAGACCRSNYAESDGGCAGLAACRPTFAEPCRSCANQLATAGRSQTRSSA